MKIFGKNIIFYFFFYYFEIHASVQTTVMPPTFLDTSVDLTNINHTSTASTVATTTTVAKTTNETLTVATSMNETSTTSQTITTETKPSSEQQLKRPQQRHLQ